MRSTRRQILADLARLAPGADADPEELRAFWTARKQLLDALQDLPPDRVDDLGRLVEAPEARSQELLRRRDTLARARRQLERTKDEPPPRGSHVKRRG